MGSFGSVGYLADDIATVCIPMGILSLLTGMENSFRWEYIHQHAHSLLAHLSTHRTLTLLRDHLWWKSMASDVQKHCESCMTCRRSKPDNQKPYRLLNPLSVPSRPWQAIAVEFVGPMPKSSNQDGTCDEITTIINLHSGMVHLVLSRQTCKAPEVAE